MKGKIIFITGASSGIGEGCARKFASEGSDLILNARNNDKLKTLKSNLETKYGIEVHLLPFDVRDREIARTSIESLQGKWRNIDVLINNAGLVIGFDKEFEGNLDEWDNDIAESVYFAASAPAHVQIAEMLVLATNQATSNVSYRSPK